MKLGWVIYYVPDVEATLAFYEAAFDCRRGMVTPGGEFGTLVTGETTLAFCAEHFLADDGFAFEKMRPARTPQAFEIAFMSEDVAAAYDRAVKAGAVPLVPPQAKPWGQIVSYVRDLNGFQVEICSPVA